jgi:F-type H+-transporting ATPase subunit a
MLFSPLEQFRYPITIAFESFVFDLNLSIYILIILQIITLYFLHVYLSSVGLISNRFVLVISEFYNIAYKFTQDFLGTTKVKSKNVYPAILTLFLFLVMVNLSGIVPYTTTITTHFFVTGGLAITFSIGMLITNIKTHDIEFLNFFLPHGIPGAIAPFIIMIELILYFFRPLSLALRLFANMMAGHTLLKIISVSIYSVIFKTIPFIVALKFFYFILFVGMLNFIILLEVFVCIIQAYVFTLLICIYVKDVYVAH